MIIWINPGGCTRLPGAPFVRAQDVGDSEDPEPREAADRDATLPSAEAGGDRAQRSAAPQEARRAAAAAPGQHARQGDRRAELQGESLYVNI